MGIAGKSLVLAAGILALCGSAALADLPIGAASPLRYPGAPKPVYDDPKTPYPMNYTDEAAQRLGVQNGHMDVFSSQPAENNPLVPVFSGGVSGDGAMLRLQWHPGL